jgi:hypothetical protein
VFYPRPIPAMPDILMIARPAEPRSASLPFEAHHPILIETTAELHELEAQPEEAWLAPGAPEWLDARPSAFPADHITVAHYGPPSRDWPFVLLCRWPPDLVAAAPDDLRIFVRGAYTIELFSDRNGLERASNTLLGLLKRRREVRIEIIMPDWSAVPGKAPH